MRKGIWIHYTAMDSFIVWVRQIDADIGSLHGDWTFVRLTTPY